jgi:glycine oxidase
MTRNALPLKPAIAIIGGGVIGLSIGWRLALAGASVAVFERGATGRGASWAAAGMLAAGSEVEPGEGALFGLLRRSQAMWPAFAAEIAAACGIDVRLRQEGTLSVALNADELGRLRQTYALQQSLGVVSRWLSRAEALALEPYINPRLTGAILVEGDHQVDNRLLAEALKLCLIGAGGVLHEHIGDVSLKTHNGRVIGVEAGGVFTRSDTVVLAAGAWSAEIAGLPENARPPVRPVKGQMLKLAMDPAAPLITRTLWTQKAYIVPRIDGALLVGATTEECGFDAALTAGGMLSLLDSVWRVLPGVEELPLIETWAGFRPGSRDDAPILGATDVDGLILATGHHRNGILLTPITAATIADLILTGRTDPAIAAFSLSRFTGAAKFERNSIWTSA